MKENMEMKDQTDKAGDGDKDKDKQEKEVDLSEDEN